MNFRTPIPVPDAEEATTWRVIGPDGGTLDFHIDRHGNVTSPADWYRPLTQGRWLLGVDEDPHPLRWRVGV
ncbi:hypothetical protein [Streptomyces sp. NPDC093261]|uniref:hypothetical protein n=1 Tax=Streptomyces sp. NPDC093261 TaxID=3366037 RepID=UPI0038146C96